MQKTLLFKIAIIASLCIMFAIGLLLLKSLVYERQRYANNVQANIAQQHVQEQTLITPFLLAEKLANNQISEKCQSSGTDTSEPNATQQNHTQSNDGNNGNASKKADTDLPSDPSKNLCQTTKSGKYAITASQSNIHAVAQVAKDKYKRGIYHAVSYQSQLDIKQSFLVQDANQLQQLKLIIPITDLRGVSQLPKVKVTIRRQDDANTEQDKPKAISISATYPDGMSDMSENSYLEVNLTNAIQHWLSNPNNADIPSQNQQAILLETKLDMDLAGLGSLQTIPVGEQFVMSMQSNWLSPLFTGYALPNDKAFDNQGFSANWHNQHLAINNARQIKECVTTSCNLMTVDTHMLNDDTYGDNVATYVEKASEVSRLKGSIITHLQGFDVRFAEPNNVYLQTERTMKYALLLIFISFATFFLFEVIKSLRIHPIQYLLVGSALLVFYILLLSLAEQILFWQAYVIAACACVGLIGWYAYYVLNSVSRAVVFTLILGGLYAGFYGILTSEDLNLLLGAVFCFVLLASVMYLTRHINWYDIN